MEALSTHVHAMLPPDLLLSVMLQTRAEPCNHCCKCVVLSTLLQPTSWAPPAEAQPKYHPHCQTHLWLVGAVEVRDLPRGQEASRVVHHRVQRAVPDGLGGNVLRVISTRQAQLLSNVLQEQQAQQQRCAHGVTRLSWVVGWLKACDVAPARQAPNRQHFSRSKLWALG